MEDFERARLADRPMFVSAVSQVSAIVAVPPKPKSHAMPNLCWRRSHWSAATVAAAERPETLGSNRRQVLT